MEANPISAIAESTAKYSQQKYTPPSKPAKSKKQEREDLLFYLAEEKANCTGELRDAINFQLDQTA